MAANLTQTFHREKVELRCYSPCPARLGCNSYKAKFALGVAENSLISGSKEKLAHMWLGKIVVRFCNCQAAILQPRCKSIAGALRPC